MKRNRRISTCIAVGVAAICVILAGRLIIAITMKQTEDRQKTITEEDTSNDVDELLSYKNITYGGKTYTYNPNISTCLFMGVDQHNPVTVNGYKGTGGRTDSMILFIMNKEENTTTMLGISRDSMVEVAVYDVNGIYAMTSKMQIAMQYSYGDGAKKSCRLTKEAVSKLLYGIPINTYLSMNIDGIAAVTDAIGGVDIIIPEDYTQIDPLFMQNAAIRLDGTKAEKYVRSRDCNTTGSNDSRMERQTQFMKAIVAKIKSGTGGADLYKRVLEQASPYLVTDMDAEELYTLAKYQLKDNTYKIPGETVEGSTNDEYHIDDNQLKTMLVELCYVEN